MSAGVVTSGLAIYDTMQYLRAPVSTMCIGMAASMASVLLAAGAKGKRYALPNARIMIHQGSAGFRGNTPDVLVQVKEVEELNNRLHGIMAKHTGQDAEKIARFEDLGAPVDSYGVGSSLIRGTFDFTADVVELDGRPAAKVGRELRPNPRLEPVT